MIRINVNLESNIKIKKKIDLAVRKKLRLALQKVVPDIEKYLQEQIGASIMSSPTWGSLLGSAGIGLDAHFGIPKGTNSERLNAILQQWLREIKVEIIRPANVPQGFMTGLRFLAIDASWANVISLPGDPGVTINVRKSDGNVQHLEWLKWLIGLDTPANPTYEISGYKIVAGAFPKSRSGKAIMRLGGPTWAIPPEAGATDPNNNFVTRALDEFSENKEELAKFVIGRIRRAL